MVSEKKIAIIGAGISGLLACKHLMEKGFRPMVFESRRSVGGVWAYQTIESTKLQTPKTFYEFCDWPWPSSVTEAFPDHNQVLDYINSYCLHFNLKPRIKFNHKVVAIDYSPPLDDDDISSTWDEWSGNGGPFSPQRKWKLLVQNTLYPLDTPKVWEVDFVILCNGNYSESPNVPQFPIDKGPEIFDGVAMHSMEYANLSDAAVEFIKDKRVTVVGFQKSALDIALQVAKTNGVRHPCTIVFNEPRWTVPEHLNELNFQYGNRFSELMIHKPEEGFFLWLLALLLFPLTWILSTLIETYLKWIYPLKKYNMIPKQGFLTQVASCMLPTLPPTFYKRVDQGSIVLKKSRNFHFSQTGLILDEFPMPLTTDIVIFATGFRTDENFAKIFKSAYFQGCIFGSSAPFYRECIHPRIPQLAILGYSESPANLFTTEMRSKWLAHFMAGKMKLPTIKAMEEDTNKWEKLMRDYSFKTYKRSCISFLLQIHFNDLLCKDMGCNPWRKSWFIPELFEPYVPTDYTNL